MAELVAGVGVPHSPHYPSQYPKDASAQDSPRTFREVKAHLDAARPTPSSSSPTIISTRSS